MIRGVPEWDGTKFDRTRGAFFAVGGDTLRSIADAERVGGGVGDEVDGTRLLRPGEAVWARVGGGGGAAGLVGSAPAFLLIHFFSSLSYTNEVSSPRLALISLGVEESERLQNLPSQEPEEDAADAACCG